MTSMHGATACVSVQGIVGEENPWVGWVCEEAPSLQLEWSALQSGPSQEPRAVSTVTWLHFMEFVWGGNETLV